MLAITETTLRQLRLAQALADDEVRRQSTVQRSTRKLGADRLRALLKQTAHILEAGTTSAFEFEASCRHGLRSGLCAEGGWRWADADQVALTIVAVALDRIGATRPSWREGQPEWTQDGHAPLERTFCARCGTRLAPSKGIARKFCSALCRHATVVNMARNSQERVSRAEWQARVAAEKSARRSRICEQCGTTFQYRKDARQRFCSPACAAKGKDRWRRDPVACVGCHKLFKPGFAAAKFCSHACYVRVVHSDARIRTKVCPSCGETFSAAGKRNRNVFCSRACSLAVGRAAKDRIRCEQV